MSVESRESRAQSSRSRRLQFRRSSRDQQQQQWPDVLAGVREVKSCAAAPEMVAQAKPSALILVKQPAERDAVRKLLLPLPGWRRVARVTLASAHTVYLGVLGVSRSSGCPVAVTMLAFGDEASQVTALCRCTRPGVVIAIGLGFALRQADQPGLPRLGDVLVVSSASAVAAQARVAAVLPALSALASARLAVPGVAVPSVLALAATSPLLQHCGMLEEHGVWAGAPGHGTTDILCVAGVAAEQQRSLGSSGAAWFAACGAALVVQALLDDWQDLPRNTLAASVWMRQAMPSRGARCVGRAADVARVDKVLRSHKLRFIRITGQIGVGKTALVRQYLRTVPPDRYQLVLWISCDTRDARRSSIREAAACCGVPVFGETDATVLDRVLRVLRHTHSWLLVLDAAGEQDILDLARQRRTGMQHVIVTTRNVLPLTQHVQARLLATLPTPQPRKPSASEQSMPVDTAGSHGGVRDPAQPLPPGLDPAALAAEPVPEPDAVPDADDEDKAPAAIDAAADIAGDVADNAAAAASDVTAETDDAPVPGDGSKPTAGSSAADAVAGSRRASTRRLIPTLQLKPLPESALEALLPANTTSADRCALHSLTSGLPLALAHALASMRTGQLSVAQFLQLADHAAPLRRHIDGRSAVLPDYACDRIAAVFFSVLRRDGDNGDNDGVGNAIAARSHTLCSLVWLALCGIPMQLVEDLVPAFANAAAVRRDLCASGLLWRDGAGKFAISAHTQDIVMTYVAQTQTARARMLEPALATVHMWLQRFDYNKVETWPAGRVIVAHAASVCAWCAKLVSQLPDHAINLYYVSLWLLANFHERVEGDYARSLPIREQSVQVAALLYGKQHAQYAVALNELGHLHRLMGNFEDGEKVIRAAMQVSEVAVGPNSAWHAVIVKNLADILTPLKRYEEAEQLYKLVMEIQRETIGENHYNFAISMSNLATLYCDLNQHEKALPLYERVLPIYAATLGKQHHEYATALTSMASVYRELRQLDRAIELHREALALFEDGVLGRSHPRYATSVRAYGVTLHAANRRDEAKAQFTVAERIFSVRFGPDHPQTKLTRAWLTHCS